ARALMKLPRCNQIVVSRVISSLGLSSRQSDTFVKAFLSATNEAQQQYLLDCPEVAFERAEPDIPYIVARFILGH
nr:hypothetical protein [Bacteroidales bacterium]